MGRTHRKKKRCQSGQDNESENKKLPKTFVMERGKVGSLLTQLVLDLRHVMEPFTASHLKVTRRNVLKDFVSVAGPLGVSHFLMVSKGIEHVYLRVAKLSRGPTITFRVTQFSLAREVVSTLKNSLPIHSSQFLKPAVLVLNNFIREDKPSQLMATMFQNMFPTINVPNVKLADLKRCVLLSFNKETRSVEFRHYGIKIVPRGMSRGVRKIAQSKVPNLSKYEDISEYVLGGGASESEAEEAEGQVTLAQDVPGRGNIKQHQSAVRLYELGPRMTLQLIKVEDGMCNGEVLHHELIHRTKKDIKQLKKRIDGQRKLKKMRKKEQEENVKRKEREKELKRKQERIRQGKDEEDEEEEQESGDDDAEWYRQEVGVAPDPELLLKTKKLQPLLGGQKRKRKTIFPSSQPPTKKRKTVAIEKHKPSHHKFTNEGRTGPKRRVIKVSTGTVYRKKARRT